MANRSVDLTRDRYSTMPSITFTDRTSSTSYRSWVKALTDEQIREELSQCRHEIHKANLLTAGSFIGAIYGAPITGGASLAAAGVGLAKANSKGIVYRRCLNMAEAEQRRRATS